MTRSEPSIPPSGEAPLPPASHVAGSPAVESMGQNVLEFIELEIGVEIAKLGRLASACESGNEHRIAREIKNALRALEEAHALVKLYRSGAPLPTLDSMRGIMK